MGYSKIHSKKTWKDKPDKTTPINATELNRIENVLDALDDQVIEIKNAIDGIRSSLSSSAAGSNSSADGMIISVNDFGVAMESDENTPSITSNDIASAANFMPYFISENGELLTEVMAAELVENADETHKREYEQIVALGASTNMTSAVIKMQALMNVFHLSPTFIYAMYVYIDYLIESGNSHDDSNDDSEFKEWYRNTLYKFVEEYSASNGGVSGNSYPAESELISGDQKNDPKYINSIRVIANMCLDSELIPNAYQPLIPTPLKSFTITEVGTYDTTNHTMHVKGTYVPPKLSDASSDPNSFHYNSNDYVVLVYVYGGQPSQMPLEDTHIERCMLRTGNVFGGLVGYAAASESYEGYINMTYGPHRFDDAYNTFNHLNNALHYRFGAVVVPKAIYRIMMSPTLETFAIGALPNNAWYPITWDNGIYSIDSTTGVVTKVREVE